MIFPPLNLALNLAHRKQGEPITGGPPPHGLISEMSPQHYRKVATALKAMAHSKFGNAPNRAARPRVQD
jgi:hypothetical protein